MLIPQSVGIHPVIFCLRQKKVSILLRILHRQAECRKEIITDLDVNKDKLNDDEDNDNFKGSGCWENNGMGRVWHPLKGRRTAGKKMNNIIILNLPIFSLA